MREFRGLLPVSALDGVSGGNGRGSIVPRVREPAHRGKRLQFVQNLFGLHIQPGLQIRVLQIVHGMQALIPSLTVAGRCFGLRR